MKIVSVSAILGVSIAFRLCHVTAKLHDSIRDLIIEGRDANPGEFPSFVAGLGCGGTLIHEDIVLTAAHCNVQFKTIVQVGGTINPSLYSPDGEIISPVCLLKHPKYVQVSNDNGLAFVNNDIALVKLARPSTAPLVELNFDPSIPSVHDTVTAIGYGISGYKRLPGQTSEPKNPDILQVLSPLSVQSVDVCSVNSPDVYRADSQLCVNDDDPVSTVCLGDSGGPIFAENGVQVGLLSFSYFKPDDTHECDGSKPTYWTSIAKYKSFIKEGICGKPCP
jgi:secreted trypsin-like serine protease